MAKVSHLKVTEVKPTPHQQYAILLKYAEAALLECVKSNGDDYECEDRWINAVEKFLPAAKFEAWNDWCHKATAEERICEGLHICTRHMMGG